MFPAAAGLVEREQLAGGQADAGGFGPHQMVLDRQQPIQGMASSASGREEGAGIEMGGQPRLKDPSDVPVRVRLYGQVALLTLTTPGR